MKTSKLVIEFKYDYSNVHFTEKEMEKAIDRWKGKILKELQNPHTEICFNAMGLASINVTKIY